MARDKGSGGLRVGYLRASLVVNRVFNILCSLLLLVCASPLMLLIWLVILVIDGRPVFYSGARLGKNKVLYNMFKFRTLVPDAQKRIGAELFTTRFSSNRELLSSSGQFLRDTRLDELPQLFNVLRGDMDMLGPRPERPEIYERFCKRIRGYDRRFTVKPGLIGYSQIFTPHSTPKRLRHLVDMQFLKLKHRYSLEVVVVTAALFMLVLRMFRKAYLALALSLTNLVHSRREKRTLTRLEPNRATVYLAGADTRAPGTEIAGLLKDLNEEALLVYSSAPLPAAPLRARIVIPVKRRLDREVKKTAYCSCQLFSETASVPQPYRHGYVLKFTPLSPVNSYIVHQYLLEGSIYKAYDR